MWGERGKGMVDAMGQACVGPSQEAEIRPADHRHG